MFDLKIETHSFHACLFIFAKIGLPQFCMNLNGGFQQTLLIQTRLGLHSEMSSLRQGDDENEPEQQV